MEIKRTISFKDANSSRVGMEMEITTRNGYPEYTSVCDVN
jgi:hypothetical protein